MALRATRSGMTAGDEDQPLLTNNKLIHAPRPSRTLRRVSTDAGPGPDRPFVVVGTGVVRHGRRRNVPSAIAGQLETLGGCAGSGVQVLKGCVSYPAKLSAAPHAQPSRNEKDANSFSSSGNGYRAGVKPCHFPPFLCVPGKAGAPAILPVWADLKSRNADGKPCGDVCAGETLSRPGTLAISPRSCRTNRLALTPARTLR